MKCAQCGTSEGSKALHEKRWLCVACIPPIACGVCGVPAMPRGVERFAIASANTDEYDLTQDVLYLCPVKHMTFGEAHAGPGAKRDTA